MFSLKQYPLNFAANALAPYMSEQTVNYHYGHHLDTYIQNLNTLIAGTDYADMSLDEIIKQSAIAADAAKIFNNAAQVFNHDFFFRGLALDGKAEFPEKLSLAFGTRADFMAQFRAAATGVFGSGWVWVVRDTDVDVLRIITTANADSPIALGLRPILTLDVWEHAYYLDYQNLRGDFIDAFLTHLINWDFVNDNL